MRRQRRRKKRILPVILIVAVVITAAVTALCLMGIMPKSKSQADVEKRSLRIAYVIVNQQNAVVDTKGKVTETPAEEPQDLVLISGLNLGSPITGETIPCENEEYLNYALDIAEKLNNNSIKIKEIAISPEGEAELHFDKVTVKLGTESKTSEKIRDLNDLYGHVKDLCGILNMENVNDTLGYTFKKMEDTGGETQAVAQPENENGTGENPEGNFEEGLAENPDEYIEETPEDYEDDNSTETPEDYGDDNFPENPEGNEDGYPDGNPKGYEDGDGGEEYDEGYGEYSDDY